MGLSPPTGGALRSRPTRSRSLEDLAGEENRTGLAAVPLSMAERRAGSTAREEEVTLDLDSLPVEVHGHQPGSAWNGHYGVRCYHPPVAVVLERPDAQQPLFLDRFFLRPAASSSRRKRGNANEVLQDGALGSWRYVESRLGSESTVTGAFSRCPTGYGKISQSVYGRRCR